MKKNFIVAALIAINAARVVAAEPVDVQPVEGEIRIGLSTPIRQRWSYENTPGIDGGYELRCNLQKVPVAIGLMVDSYSPCRVRDNDHLRFYGGLLFGATGEYNFFRGKAVNPFVGAGIGLGLLSETNFEDKSNPQVRPFLRPKIGIEFFHHIRLNLSLTLTTPNAIGWSFSIAGVIGGRPRKKK